MDQQPSQAGSAKSEQGQEGQGVSFHSDLLFLTKINLQIWGDGWGGIRRRKSLFFCFSKKYDVCRLAFIRGCFSVKPYKDEVIKSLSWSLPDGGPSLWDAEWPTMAFLSAFTSQPQHMPNNNLIMLYSPPESYFLPSETRSMPFIHRRLFLLSFLLVNFFTYKNALHNEYMQLDEFVD